MKFNLNHISICCDADRPIILADSYATSASAADSAYSIVPQDSVNKPVIADTAGVGYDGIKSTKWLRVDRTFANKFLIKESIH